MKKYQIYGVGAALVDTEVVVTDEFLSTYKIDKGVMTLDLVFFHVITLSLGGE